MSATHHERKQIKWKRHLAGGGVAASTAFGQVPACALWLSLDTGEGTGTFWPNTQDPMWGANLSAAWFLPATCGFRS